ncbi:MAG: helix-turn-helix domain-containing protein [Peptococcaceae bacterium]|nr:helix-turn-helix domain-containing protein [Peptococcaceae bacterium]
MQQLGNVLTQAREQMGLTIDDISQITKIRSKYIRALESGNVYEIPGRVYALGFLKSYCEVLNLNYRELQEYFNANYQEKDEFAKHMATAAAVQQPVRQTGISSKRVVVFALLGACILLGGVYFFVNSRGKEAEQPPVVPPIASQQEETNRPGQSSQNNQNNQSNKNHEPVEPTTKNLAWSQLTLAPDFTSFEMPGFTAAKAYDGIEVMVEATGNCWTRVTIDDGDSSDETLHAGDIRTYQGIEKIEIKWGNAGLVKVTVNGVLQRPEEIGAAGQVVTKEFLAE